MSNGVGNDPREDKSGENGPGLSEMGSGQPLLRLHFVLCRFAKATFASSDMPL
jgi:hypothetical protein